MFWVRIGITNNFIGIVLKVTPKSTVGVGCWIYLQQLSISRGYSVMTNSACRFLNSNATKFDFALA